VEVAAMNMILKGVGYDAAEDFNRRVNEEIRMKTINKGMEAKANETNSGNSNK